MASPALKSAFVVGYTGSTGRELVKELAKSQRFEKVVLIGRRKVEYEQPELKEFEQRVVDYEKLEESKGLFTGFDVAFCCLGTTKAQAGSAEAFRRVDFDYVHQIALNCKEGGTKQFHYVSSAGANKDSYLLYPQVKGQIEKALSELPFDRVSIYRPKMLKRGKDARFVEKCFSVILKPLELIKPQLVATPCDLLSRAMISNCDVTPVDACEILDNNQIYELAKSESAQ